jgi:biotin operon repressor
MDQSTRISLRRVESLPDTLCQPVLDYAKCRLLVWKCHSIRAWGTGFSYGTVAVFERIIHIARKTGNKVFPSYDYLASVLGMSRNSVISHIKMLEREGLLVRHKRHASWSATTELSTTAVRVRLSNAYTLGSKALEWLKEGVVQKLGTITRQPYSTLKRSLERQASVVIGWLADREKRLELEFLDSRQHLLPIWQP